MPLSTPPAPSAPPNPRHFTPLTGNGSDEALRSRPHLRHNSAKQHRGAQRTQRILGPYQQRRRGAPAGALQRRQHFGDFGTSRGERLPDLVLPAVEGTNASLGCANLGLDAAHATGGVDQLLVELRAILAERGNFALQLFLGLGGALLLRAHRVELLLALLEGIAR